MRILIVGMALAITVLAGVPVAQTPGSRGPVPIFDGRTLDGWEGDLKMFRVEAGAIVGGSLQNKIARNEFLCTARSYGDVELRLKVRLLGEGANAGIQFRTRRIPDHHEVIGYQADMGPGYWGALYDESRRKKILAAPDAATLKGLVKEADWNDYVIRAEGKRVQLVLNGVRTVDYTEEDPTVDSRGLICVQIHSGPPSEAWYKDITLLDLTP
ncbi:MAG: DUF1080 domain-containing protein [Acidobacteriota bacterium]|nr:DUF1080 domain-containing protein [Acidobacteriota bacterium]